MKEPTRIQLISLVRTEVRRVVSRRRLQGAAWSLGMCVRNAERALCDAIVVMNPHTPDITREAQACVRRAHEDIEKIARDCLEKTMANIRAREISCVTCMALLKEILEEKGLPVCQVEKQVHRLKVAVPMPNGRKLRFCIRYRHYQEDISHVGEGIDEARLLIAHLGKETCII